MRRTIYVLMVAALFATTGCPKKTAELELDLAKKAIDDARAAKANDCAKETFVAAEAALAEAQQLEQDGEAEQAKEKANQAKSLAEQALAASPKDCDQPKVSEDDEKKDGATDASANININLDQALETVYFDYNDATIREDSKAMLSRVAQALSKTPAVKLEIEGHCDVRGSTEYNLHLGERRARNVQKYLVTQGVQPDRLDVISYGEEQPLDLGQSEDAHQKNRRAELKKE